MADDSPADTLSIAVKLALDEADRQYDALKRKIETPLRIPLSATDGQPTQAGVGRTFSGASVVNGPTNTSPTGSTFTPGAVGQIQQITLARAMGGTGFGPAVGPLPTAGQNTFWGNVGGVLPGGSYAAVAATLAESVTSVGQAATASYIAEGRAARAAFRSSPLALFDGGDDEGDYAFFYRRSGGYRGIGGTLGPSRVTQPFGSGDDFDFEGEVVGSRMNSTTPLLMGPQAASGSGSVAPQARQRTSGLGEVRSTFRIAGAIGAGIEAVNEIGTYIQSGTDRNRYDSLLDAAKAGYEDARGASFLTRGAASFGNYVDRAFGYSGRYIDVDSAFETLKIAQGNATTNDIKRAAYFDNQNSATIGSSGFGLQVQQAQIEYEKTTNALYDQAKQNPQIDIASGLTAAANRRNAIVNAATSQAQQVGQQNMLGAQAAALSATNDQFGAGLSSLAAQALQDQQQAARDSQGLDPATAAAYRAAAMVKSTTQIGAFVAQYNRQSASGVMATNGATQGSALSRAGFGYAGRVAEIQGERDAALNEAPTGTDPADVANRNAIRASYLEQERAAGVPFAQQSLEYGVNLKAAAQDRAFEPFDAQRTRVRGGFFAATVGEKASSPDFQLKLKQARSDLADVDQQQQLGLIDLDRSQDFDEQAFYARAARDPVGERVVRETEGYENRLVAIARSGLDPDGSRVRYSRNNAIASLQLERRDFALGFRGTQVDAQNIDFDNPRDAINPSETFKRYRDAITNVTQFDANQGKQSTDTSNSQGGSSASDIGTAVVNALQQFFRV